MNYLAMSYDREATRPDSKMLRFALRYTESENINYTRYARLIFMALRAAMPL